MEWSIDDIKVLGFLPELSKSYEELGFLPAVRDKDIENYVIDVKIVGSKYDVTIRGPTSISELGNEVAQRYGDDRGMKFSEDVKHFVETQLGLDVDAGGYLSLQREMSDGHKGYDIPRMAKSIVSGELAIRVNWAFAMAGLKNKVVVDAKCYDSLVDFKQKVTDLVHGV